MSIMTLLARAVTFCRQLTSRPQQAQIVYTIAEGADERRVWVRNPCETTARCQREGSGGSASAFSANVRNISRGGINLVVDRPFEAGAVLSVELPGADGQPPFTVLACVVHAAVLPDGEWALGCSFACELTAEDLTPFGGKRVRPVRPDQRRWMRFPGKARASYRRVTDQDTQCWPAQVVDLSPNGIGLHVAQPLDAGTLLSLDLYAETETAARVLLGCVVRVDASPEGGWVAGCNFLRELTEDELQALL
jgi:hypothetical protein